ncbi:MAG: aconitate hydratase [Bacteroidaceae bacterium]|nr:aconitate hydratase [Bacteroidaceae bacterium]
MIFDIDAIRAHYATFSSRVALMRQKMGRALTLSEKILYAHLYDQNASIQTTYANFRPDRVAMQDATAQMALLQFMNAGMDKSAVPATIHCDHLICACEGSKIDLPCALRENAEVYDFLKGAAARYGMGYWAPGAGIIHQVVLENYAFPGGMMVGTDSHTPNAGGLGMIAIGVGGADAVDVLTGMEWELRIPRRIGVHLIGSLSNWASPKDVILKLAGILTVKGGTNAIIEYFGEGTKTLSCTGKATICNMGAEVGATTSVFPYDERMAAYLKKTGREEVAQLADSVVQDLQADPEVIANPEAYYDTIIEINLSELTPYINGPFTPDAATSVNDMKQRVAEMDYPEAVEVALIGSCTNSSYEDLMRAASVAKQALEAGLKPKAQLIINPGSELIRATAERDGLLQILREAGAIEMTNACGPCIGQWKRKTNDPTKRNSIVTTFNRNFAKRADGNPNTHAFIVSPEMAVALTFAGKLTFNPLTDGIGDFKFSSPKGNELPIDGFATCDNGYVAPQDGMPEPYINPESKRLQRLERFKAWDGKDFENLPLLIKTKGKCTTDHISMAGPWLRFRGHLENISENCLMGAVNAFTGETNAVKNQVSGQMTTVHKAALAYRANGGAIVVAEENYGEGSSREHAAMEPRFLGIRAIVAKSFARIHETNLKKQGVLALTFKDASDYDKVMEDDRLSINVSQIQPGNTLTLCLKHANGTTENIEVVHTYNEQQIEWFKAGAALNLTKK